MITCPNCGHPNQEGTKECEACFIQLPASQESYPGSPLPPTDVVSFPEADHPTLPTNSINPLANSPPEIELLLEKSSDRPSAQIDPGTVESPSTVPFNLKQNQPSSPQTRFQVPGQQSIEPSKTPAQIPAFCLIHLRTKAIMELPNTLDTIHIGKPGEQVTPDIDVSGFIDSDIVSRLHARIQVEGEKYYLEDAGSTNGTYVNNRLLPAGERYQLSPGDRISLGQDHRVSFEFQKISP